MAGFYRSVLISVPILLSAAVAFSQSPEEFYQGKSIRLIVGGAAGGGYDAVGRLVARHIGRHIPGSPSISVENMSGAGSLIMMNYIEARSVHDGTVLGLPTTNILLEKKLRLLATTSGNVSFDVDKLSWLGSPAREPQVLFVWRDTPFNSIGDMQQHQMIIGAVSVSTDTYILPMLMKDLLGTKTTAIPGYKGSPEILAAMERREVDGHVALLANITAGNSSYLKEGKIRILLQFGTRRSSELSNVPTAAELAPNSSDREMLEYYGTKYEMSYPLVAPSGVPKDRIKLLRSALEKTVADPKYQEEARRIGVPLNPMFGQEMEAQIQKMNDVSEKTVSRLREIILRSSKPAN